ncbi:hypothetical protein HZU77_008245 [Neisseriaceae bacterium TC5R-5]|nr:hypothetical protein [Neisseriaceae bacterium TC5R-5]
MTLSMIRAALILTMLPAWVLAQTADEQLLAAQMYYQQIGGQQQDADARVSKAQEAKAQAQQRLADAQQILERANGELSTAQAAQQQAQQAAQAAVQALNEAWRRKESGQ